MEGVFGHALLRGNPAWVEASLRIPFQRDYGVPSPRPVLINQVQSIASSCEGVLQAKKTVSHRPKGQSVSIINREHGLSGRRIRRHTRNRNAYKAVRMAWG